MDSQSPRRTRSWRSITPPSTRLGTTKCRSRFDPRLGNISGDAVLASRLAVAVAEASSSSTSCTVVAAKVWDLYGFSGP
jgi:hypothetical protein